MPSSCEHHTRVKPPVVTFIPRFTSGWLSDDEECSSGSDSKESSGGSKDIATLNLRAPRPPGLPRGGQDHTRRRLEQLSQQLYLDIPSSGELWNYFVPFLI